MLPLSDELLKKTLRSEGIWKFYKNLCFNCKHGLVPIPPPPQKRKSYNGAWKPKQAADWTLDRKLRFTGFQQFV